MTKINAKDVLNLSVGDVGEFLSQHLSELNVTSREIIFEGTSITTKRKVRYTIKVEEI